CTRGGEESKASVRTGRGSGGGISSGGRPGCPTGSAAARPADPNGGDRVGTADDRDVIRGRGQGARSKRGLGPVTDERRRDRPRGQARADQTHSVSAISCVRPDPASTPAGPALAARLPLASGRGSAPRS